MRIIRKGRIMPAYFCYKPKGSCPTCEHYRHDPESGTKACFAAQDKKNNTHNAKKVHYIMDEYPNIANDSTNTENKR